ncbi:MAG: PSD1 domain-containing protein [Planctomycetes bacterium]|nr:PSD1 domain-containing protein [Planctomycetota bacterium]
MMRIVSIVLALTISATSAIAQPKDGSFEKSVLPIFRARCLNCHGEKRQRAGLDLRTKTTTLKGGESGASLKPGTLKGSILWEKIRTDEMPEGKVKLTAAEKDVIKRWIEAGAPGDDKAVVPTGPDVTITDEDRKFWAFQTPVRPSVPPRAPGEGPGVRAGRFANPIDAFIAASLQAKGLALSPEAEPLVLLRRVTFDLTGLPPTLKEIDDFLKDASTNPPGAYEKAVDRLLASPRYGERWGRHWLDLAGYADSEGILDADYVRSAAWRYRDYVIRAFNSDKPYDRFLQEQIAGDELVDYWKVYQTEKTMPPQVVEALIATGYLRCASDTSRPDFVNIKNAPGYYFQTLDDTLKIVTSTTMGLTLQCARCHSHKYDPIPQTDYYRMQAIFMSGYRPYKWIPQVQRKLSEATAFQEKDATEQNAKLNAAIADLKKQQAALKKDGKDPGVKATQKRLTDEIKTLEGKKRTFAEIRAFYDLPGEAKTHLLKRGEYLHPGPEVTPNVLRVLANHKSFVLPPRAKDARTSGRRLAFAKWLTSEEHPLTARVLVNRLWLHHFGVGLVSTPDNFGKTGSPPSHPALLDWLACEFMSPTSPERKLGDSPARARGAGKWSIKYMQRLIVTSAAYKQLSAYQAKLHASAKRIDPDNRLLWRQRLRRLEGEAMRDAVLAVSGTLNTQMFGPPVPMIRTGEGEVNTPANPEGDRRSIYLQVRRSQPLTFLQLFDQPVIETNCTRRETSTVASQALTLLNSDFMTRQAEAFAGRVLKEEPNDPARHAVRLAFARLPTAAETRLFARFLEQQANQHAKLPPMEARRRAVVDLCHMLLSANEFAYVD